MKMKKGEQFVRSCKYISTPRRQVDGGGEQCLTELAPSRQSSYLYMFSEFSLQLNVIIYSFKSLLSRLCLGIC